MRRLHAVALIGGLADGVATDFCSVFPDLQAALDHAIDGGLADRVSVWGSSYSAPLVFRLAAENPDRVAGILAFSPASGGPMADCRARNWIDRVEAPAIAFRPASEMERPSSVEQRDELSAAGVDFRVIPGGTHGSSLLVDARTGGDMGEARAAVIRVARADERRPGSRRVDRTLADDAEPGHGGRGPRVPPSSTGGSHRERRRPVGRAPAPDRHRLDRR